MDDILKISNDKRHRSSSSLAGIIEGARSERRLDIRDFIPEADDHFAVAESRCDDLQEKINLVKTLKRKKKLKKRSMTTIAEPISTADNVPLITVRTQPKKKVSQQAARMHRLDMSQQPHPTRGYLDPALIEQHQMLDRVNAYNLQQKPAKTRGNRTNVESGIPRSRVRRNQAEGDIVCGQGVQMSMPNTPQEVACGDDNLSEHTEVDMYGGPNDVGYVEVKSNVLKKQNDLRHQTKQMSGNRRRHVPKETIAHTAPPQKWTEQPQERWRDAISPVSRNRKSAPRHANNIGINTQETEPEGRPVVELFNKNRPTSEPWPQQLQVNLAGEMKGQKGQYVEEITDTSPFEDVSSAKPRKQKTNRRVKYHTRRYEMPTVSSQMKQAGFRYYYGNTNHTNIPFVVSKSTAPSHNVGVNLQQVLNGLKVQQPLSGIPLTIAHHMGLRHVPTYGTRSATAQPMLCTSEINVIKVGRRMLHLPSYKYVSYNRLLSLYREGDGIVPRFLRAISRPHYFYTSMYNLATNREDFDAATSKGHGGSQEAKQSLAEYANLYREYERVEKSLSEKYEPELELRKMELARQLTAREDYIRKVVQESKAGMDVEPVLRASASTAEEAYHHSTFKLNADDPN